ncbi:MAG: hypothetical protein NVSMB47_07380 [Polyangiales bacterium]
MRRTLPLCLALPLALLACSAQPPDGVARARTPIIHGVPSDASQDAVVLIVYNDAATGSSYTCSGTLIAPNLVLTARHCVSVTSDLGMTCGADGIGSVEGKTGADYAPSSLTIFVGVNAPKTGALPDGTGKQIFHDDATNTCDHDLALILLTAPVKGAKIAPLRLDDTRTRRGETLTAVGWGVTDTTFDPPQRMQRSGIRILGVGKDVAQDIAPHELLVGESICSGDSGGPGLSASGAVIAIVSRGGNSNAPDPTKPGIECTGLDTTNDYTRVAPFKATLDLAFAAAGATPLLEGDVPDAGPADAGAAEVGADAGADAPSVDAPHDAASTSDAEPRTDASPAEPRSEAKSGCSASGTTPSTRAPLAWLGLMLAGALVRRRRARLQNGQ